MCAKLTLISACVFVVADCWRSGDLVFFNGRLPSFASDECSPVNWLSQTRRNLTIQFLNLDFASNQKMNSVASIFCVEVFIFLCFASFPFCKCIPLLSLFDINILQDGVRDLKISTRSVTVNTFNWLRRKKILPENMDKK